MAQAKVDIWNQALLRIGVTDLLEDEEDDRVEAKVCGLHWDRILREMLGLYPWTFARAQKPIAELAAVTRTGWEHIYQLPTDFISPVGIVSGETRLSLVPGEEQAAYEVQADDAGEGKVFCCDLAPTDIDALSYTRVIDTPTAYPAGFESALAFALAGELALAVPKDKQLGTAMLQQAGIAAARAFAVDSRGRRESPTAVPPSSIRARS